MRFPISRPCCRDRNPGHFGRGFDLFARNVLPEFRDEWNDDGWVNYWWPEQLRDRVGESVPVAVGGQ